MSSARRLSISAIRQIVGTAARRRRERSGCPPADRRWRSGAPAPGRARRPPATPRRARRLEALVGAIGGRSPQRLAPHAGEGGPEGSDAGVGASSTLAPDQVGATPSPQGGGVSADRDARACAGRPSASASASVGPASAGKAAGVAADDRGALEEVVDRQARREARRAAGGQHVVGAGHIVADGLRGVAAEEDRAGVAHPVGQPLGLVHRELDVLGRDAVDQAGRVVQRRDDHRAVVAPGSGGVVAGRQRRQLPLDRGDHRVGEGGVVGDQDRLGGRVVLGLARAGRRRSRPGRWRRRPPPRSRTARPGRRCRRRRRAGAWRR